jgi:hypothetical protein
MAGAAASCVARTVWAGVHEAKHSKGFNERNREIRKNVWLASGKIGHRQPINCMEIMCRISIHKPCCHLCA